MHRVEGANSTDDAWPAATFGADFGHGVNLYRANMRSRFRRPTLRHTDTPVQLGIVPAARDRYVTRALLDGLEAWSTLTVWRREVNAGHWVVRTHPHDDCHGWIREA